MLSTPFHATMQSSLKNYWCNPCHVGHWWSRSLLAAVGSIEILNIKTYTHVNQQL